MVYKRFDERAGYEKRDAVFKQFVGFNYDQLRDIYPQRHLLKEMDVPSKYKQRFDEALAEEKSQGFSLMEHFGLEKQPARLKPIGLSDNGPETKQKIVQEVGKFHDFLAKNQTKLTHLKIGVLEALYPTNKFGYPLHIIERDKILNEKLKEIKVLVKSFVPMEKKDLELIEQALQHRDLNGHFFDYILSKRRKMPHLKLKGGKTFVPDAKNLVKIHKEYLMKQFYMEDGEYRSMWISNFYEN